MYEKITSTKTVLDTCKQLLIEKGFDAINMREISQACHISLGSLYNYFDSKGSLIYQLVVSIFDEIFTITQEERDQIVSVSDGIRWLTKKFREGNEKYKFFISSHASIFNEGLNSQGRKMMHNFLEYIKENLFICINKDPKVRKDRFANDEQKMIFLEFIVRILKISLINNYDDIDKICFIIDQYLYY